MLSLMQNGTEYTSTIRFWTSIHSLEIAKVFFPRSSAERGRDTEREEAIERERGGSEGGRREGERQSENERESREGGREGGSERAKKWKIERPG